MLPTPDDSRSARGHDFCCVSGLGKLAGPVTGGLIGALPCARSCAKNGISLFNFLHGLREHGWRPPLFCRRGNRDPQTETLIRVHELPRGVAHVRPQLCRPPGAAPSSPSQASGHAPAEISWSDRRFPVLPIRDITNTKSKEPRIYGLSNTQTCTGFQVCPRRATSRRLKLSVQSE